MASRESSQHGGQIRLRADSSAHGSNSYAVAVDLAEGGSKPVSREGTVRGGLSRDSFSPDQPPAADPDKAEREDPQAWFVKNGVPRGNENTVWRWPVSRGVAAYFSKWKGRRGHADDIPPLETIILATIGSFCVRPCQVLFRLVGPCCQLC